MTGMSSRAPRVALLTLGCKVNQADSEAVARSLGIDGTGAAADEAEVVIINTCTVTGEADHKARKAVRHALGLPGAPVVVVTGCLAAVDAEGVAALGERVIVEADKSRVAEAVRQALPGVHEPAVAPAAPARSRARAQLKVEDGCDAFCTYCIVPYARGVPRPVPFPEVVAEARRLACAGVPEVVLTGINIGRYDDGGSGLPALLTAVADTGIPRIRLSSIEPRDVTDGLLAAAADADAFCRHLHVPLQSGSDSVLARMGRPYTTAEYAAVIGRARRAFPGIAITTDIIAGFPGETDREHAETLAFAEACGFSRIHVFRYSPRRGTPAAAMPDQVEAPVKSARAAALRELGERLACAYGSAHEGTVLELLVERHAEGPDGEPCAEGTTREYLRVAARAAGDVLPGPGALVRVLVERDGRCGRLAARIVG